MGYKFESCAELSRQYEEQVKILLKKLDTLRQEVKKLTGEDRYRANKKILVYEDMLFELKITIMHLQEYK